MDKLKINYFVDVLLIISFVVVAITSLVIFFYLPSGIRQGGQQTFLGIQKLVFNKIHTISGLAMIGLSVVHLVLHFNWLVNVTKAIFAKKENTSKIVKKNK